MRKGGPRVERERVAKDGLWIVHAYGHGGYGYQSSYGSAYMVFDLVERVVRERAGGVAVVDRAKL